MGDLKIPFPNSVRFNKPIWTISTGYLRWLAEQEWFFEKYPEHAERVEEELQMRDNENSHFFEDKV